MAGTAVFVFPSAAGHVNPSLPLCQRLVALGWCVEYLAISTFKSAVESTGATFHDLNAVFAEVGIEDVRSMIMKTFSEYDDPQAMQWAINFGSIAAERLLPTYVSFLRKHSPSLVVYCPVLSQTAHFAAMHLKIPDVSLLTTAGPGYWDAAFAAHGGGPESLIATVKANEPNRKAIEGIRSFMGMPELSLNTSRPLVRDYYTHVNLVSTIPSLADALNDEDARFYESAGKQFEFVGPLLGEQQAMVAAPLSEDETVELFAAVEKASAANRQVVYVSMGTVITGDNAEFGWNGTSKSALTGKQMCHAVYRAVFAELGSQTASAGATSLLSPPPLIVISVGPQPDAIEGISVPDNAICLQSVPQVALLRKARPALFVTNGGQNSFMEALSVGTPLLVCPGFGDQITNAAKAQARGLGSKVDRPTQTDCDGGITAESAYEACVRQALQDMLGASRQTFVERAQACAAELEKGGGVENAVRILMRVAALNA